MIHLPVVETSAAVGVASPFIAAILKQDRASKRVNTIIALCVSVVAGVAVACGQGHLSAENIAAAIVTVHTVASGFYAGLWKPVGLEPSLQAATSVAFGKSKAALAAELAAARAALAAYESAHKPAPAEPATPAPAPPAG